MTYPELHITYSELIETEEFKFLNEFLTIEDDEYVFAMIFTLVDGIWKYPESFAEYCLITDGFNDDFWNQDADYLKAPFLFFGEDCEIEINYQMITSFDNLENTIIVSSHGIDQLIKFSKIKFNPNKEK